VSILAERLTAQLLAGKPARDPVTVARRLLAVQAQDLRGARLAIRARSAGLSAAEVDRALSVERTLVVTWLNRGTLHLICSEDYHWLAALTAPPLMTANARRLSQEGVNTKAAERGVGVIESSLAEEGPLTRAQLRERLDSAGVPTKGQALVHLLMLASLRGLTVRGPVIGREHAYVLVREWVEKPAKIDRARALAELARRYLAGHGPASDRDLARWSGLPLRDARLGFREIASELRQLPDGLLDLSKRSATAELPQPRLLGPFEPVLLGWASREQIVGSHQALVTVNGIFRPFALVRGKAVARWSIDRGELRLEPFAPLSRKNAEALASDACDVARYLGQSVS
jgi:hypothetical protein